MERGGKFACSLTKGWVNYWMLEIQCIEKLLLEGKIRFPLKVISLNFVAVAAVVDVFFFLCVLLLYSVFHCKRQHDHDKGDKLKL